MNDAGFRAFSKRAWLGTKAPFWIAGFLYLVYLGIGIELHDHYGVTFDEEISRTNGAVTIKYLFQILFDGYVPRALVDVPDLATWMDRDYGVAFEAPLAALELAFGFYDGDVADAYEFRHLITFLFCALGPLAIWGILRERYPSAWIALLGAGMFIVSPRFFAESFYNSKDVVFMVAFALAILTMVKFLKRPGVGLAVLHGFATAYATDIRIMAVVIAFGTVAVAFVKWVKGEWHFSQSILLGALYVLSFGGFVVLMFPYLWADPFGNLRFVFENMAQFRWNALVLFQGEFIRAEELPWTYLPVWVGITVPLATLAFVGIGTTVISATILRANITLWRTDDEMMDFIFLALAAGPIIVVIVLDSIVYDGWRQLYFIYPAMVLVGVRGFVYVFELAQRSWLGVPALTGFMFLATGWTVAWMWSAHPIQNVFFNPLAGSDWISSFEVDYWGVSNRQALEWIAQDSSADLITVGALSVTSLKVANLGLPAPTRNRLITDLHPKPDYLVNNFRLFKALPEDERNLRTQDYAVVYELVVAGELITQVLRLNEDKRSNEITISRDGYSAEEMSDVSLALVGIERDSDHFDLELRIQKAGSPRISALTLGTSPVRLSWRLLGMDGTPLSGFDTRAAIPADIPAAGSILARLEIPHDAEAGAIEISMVSEGRFWLHDVGLTPLVVPLPDVERDDDTK